MSRSVTSVDVAQAAGVSQSTVSLVVSGKADGRVSAATQALVLETAGRLGYHPNASARVLRNGNAQVLALAVPDVKHPFFGAVLEAAEVAAREHGYAVTLHDTTSDPTWAQRMVQMLGSGLLAGCIVYAGEAPRSLLALGKTRVLLVEAETEAQAGVDIDIRQGMHAVVQHLAALGHRRIGYLAADYPKATFRRRFDNFLAEMDRAGLSFETGWRMAATFDLETATDQAAILLENAHVTAVFCDDDLLAGALYRAARRLDILIPAGLSVVGFDDIDLARMLSPELTTVAIPAEEIGRNAVEALLRQLDKGRRVRPHVVPLELKVRGSTARPAGPTRGGS